MSGLRAALPRYHRGALSLFLLTAILTALVGDQPWADALRLQPQALITSWALWQPLTANFVFPEGDAGLLIGTFVIQWFMGSPLEDFWGTRKYLLLVVGCATAGYATYALLALWLPFGPHGGATAMDLATATAFGVVFAKRELQFLGAATLQGRTLAAFVVGLTLLAPLLRGASWPLVVPWLIAVAGAYLLTTQPWRGSRDSGTVRGSKARKKPKRQHLQVVPSNPDLMN